MFRWNHSSHTLHPGSESLSWAEWNCWFSTGCSWCAPWWPWEPATSPEPSGWSDLQEGWIHNARCLSARTCRNTWCPHRRPSLWWLHLPDLKELIQRLFNVEYSTPTLNTNPRYWVLHTAEYWSPCTVWGNLIHYTEYESLWSTNLWQCVLVTMKNKSPMMNITVEY